MRGRILFLNGPTYLGGAEISLLTLLRHLDPARYAAWLITTGEGPLAKATRDIGIGVQVWRFPHFSRRQPWQVWLNVWRLAKEIRHTRTRLVVSNSEVGLEQIMYACRLARVPYLVCIRDAVRDWFSGSHLRALHRAARVVANSRWIARKCEEAGLHPGAIEVVYPPVDTDAFMTASEDEALRLRDELGVARDALVVGCVGQIHPLKGQAEFVDAAGLVADRVAGAVFIVAGSAMTPDQELFARSIQSRVSQLGLGDRFRFAGFRRDVARVVRALDILVIPSHSESFGRVAVEGMAAGRAIVASACGGIPEVLEHDLTGILVPPRSPEALAAAIVRLCMDRDLRVALGERARWIAPRFGIAPHLDRMSALFDTLLS